MFVTSDDNLILFVSFGGRKYDDSPKAIYEAMVNDERYKGCKFVWAFNDINKYDIPVGEIVKCDTLKYFIIALRAGVWVTNSSVERGLSFKGEGTLYFDTWHGTPLKKMGADVVSTNKSFGSKGKWDVDIFTVQSDYELETFAKAFVKIPREKFRLIGLPRNDIYNNVSDNHRNSIRKKLNLPTDKQVILYAPTYREYEKDESMRCVANLMIDIDRFRKELQDRYVLLIRVHYEIANQLGIVDDDFVRDVSNYSQLEDLMIASDMLVSDYSSIFFDYSIMHKPMICYAYDYEKYNKERGMYFDIREYLPTAETEEELLDILKMDIMSYSEKTKLFQETFVTEYGNATMKSLDIIAEMKVY